MVNTAFADLQFEAGNDVIKEESIGSLEELAKLLNKNKTWELKIAGHTDNDGDAAKNMALSRQRTLAVKKLLTDREFNRKELSPNGSDKVNLLPLMIPLKVVSRTEEWR